MCFFWLAFFFLCLNVLHILKEKNKLNDDKDNIYKKRCQKLIFETRLSVWNLYRNNTILYTK